MDWKKIMNRFKKGSSKVRNENELHNEKKLQKENEVQKEIIQEYLNDLLPELNLRLFLEMSDDEAIYVNCGKITNVIKWPQMMLLAENITVTSYNDTVNTHQTKRRIFNRLMGRRTSKRSFTLKKYKKERR